MSSESIVKTNPPELHVPVDNLYTHVVSARAGWVHRIGGQVPVDRRAGTSPRETWPPRSARSTGR